MVSKESSFDNLIKHLRRFWSQSLWENKTFHNTDLKGQYFSYVVVLYLKALPHRVVEVNGEMLILQMIRVYKVFLLFPFSYYWLKRKLIEWVSFSSYWLTVGFSAVMGYFEWWDSDSEERSTVWIQLFVILSGGCMKKGTKIYNLLLNTYIFAVRCERRRKFIRSACLGEEGGMPAGALRG